MPSFQADPSNFADLLQIVRDGCEISLEAGDYKGPFTVNKSITIRGTGADSVIFTVDEPALVVKVAGVRLENLSIQRTVGGDSGEVVIFAEPGTSPHLDRVRLRGIAQNVCWEDGIWEIPALLEFGEIETNRLVQRSWQLEIGTPCEIICDLNWLRVQPSHLCPGLQNLEVALNSRDILPGTNLSGSFFLSASDGKRKIEISAKIKASQPSTNSQIQGKTREKEAVANWGYQFPSRVRDRLIREIETYPGWDGSARDRIDDLLQEPNVFYVRRQAAERNEEKWELTLATDRDDFQLPEILQKLQKTLCLRGLVSSDGSSGLRLLDASLVFLARGRSDGFAVPYRIRLLPAQQYNIGVPRSALKRMASVPSWSDRHLPTEEQLQVWNAFLDIEERLARAAQFCIPFLRHNYGSATKHIVFEIDENEATLDGFSENSLKPEDFWKRAARSRNEDIKLFESSPKDRSGREGRLLGRVEEVDPERSLMCVKLERDLVEAIASRRYQLPATGFLFFESAGEISQIERKKKALKDLQQGRSYNPYLSKFLFDASAARTPKKFVKLQSSDLLLPSANPGQLAAVEAVLSAQDLVLIQGPPGTGKTTVIAEICYQIALRGGRTLIASQANLAVDNALSRLVHSPVIRALRKGKADKVQEEGQPFLEDNAIATWLQKTSTYCETDLQKRRETIKFYQKLLASSARLSAYLKSEEEREKNQKLLQERRVNLEAKWKAIATQHVEAEAQQQEVESLLVGLESLLAVAPFVEWDNPEVANFLPRLKPYVEGESAIQKFLTNVRMAKELAAEIGWVPPARGAFGLAAWVRESVAPWLSESESAIACPREVVAAMQEFERAVLVFRQNSASVEQLQRNYQQSLANQQNLQQRIQSLEKRKADIDLVIAEVQQWLSVARESLYKILKKCREERQIFSPELIKIPPRLVAIAQLSNVPLLPIFQANLIDWWPDLELLKKALSYEKEGGFIDRRGKQYCFSEFLHLSLSAIPIVLSPSDRAQWQEIARQFSTYPHLAKNQRQVLIEKSQQFLGNVQQKYAASWEPPCIDNTLKRLAEEIIDGILNNARPCVKGIKTETEQQLLHFKKQLDEQMRLISKLNAQGSSDREQLEIARTEVDEKFNCVRHLLQELTQRPQVPETFRSLAEQYLCQPSEILAQIPYFSEQVHSLENRSRQLEKLISLIDPFEVLLLIKNRLEVALSRLKQQAESPQRQIAQFQSQIQELEEQLQQASDNLLAEKTWWESAWQEIPDRLKPPVPSTGLFDLNFLRQVKAQFDDWQQELEREVAYLNRYQNLVEDWIEKLRNPSERDRNDLKQIYLDNANVIGITCVQAANRSFSEEFKNFDVVIIDEVSKCTPPELLIPALKGKRLVLVGDHRQLPPMLNDSTLEEIAEGMNRPKEELSFLEESLFKSQFETAPDSIKIMLTTQYRMHPSIMGAINQFYAHRLECGIPDPDVRRAHNLAGPILPENCHIVWVKMPAGKLFEEESRGTSFINEKEVDVIERLCEQMEASWSAKVAEGQARKEIGIITFYGAQLRLIEERLDSRSFPSLTIRTGTVDRFQGMERPVIIVSMVRNNSQRKVGFAKKAERVNVAFSRAQELLAIVGCRDLFTQQPGQIGNMYSEISNVVRRHGGLIDVSSILC